MEYQRIAHRGVGVLFLDTVETGTVPLLGGFNLEFTNSDHKIHSIIVGHVTSSGEAGQNYDTYLLEFVDADAGTPAGNRDPVNLWAKILPLDPGLTFSVSGVSSGSERVTVPVAPINEDHLFLLRGFLIQTRGETNHNLRRLAIRHDKSSNTVSCIFRDDSPNDDGFAFHLLYSVVPKANTGPERAEFYFTGPYQCETEFIESTLVNKPRPGFSVLSGFDFEFQDSDHHIRKISIDPISDQQFSLTFTDDERDNPVSAWIEYAVVHE